MFAYEIGDAMVAVDGEGRKDAPSSVIAPNQQELPEASPASSVGIAVRGAGRFNRALLRHFLERMMRADEDRISWMLLDESKPPDQPLDAYIVLWDYTDQPLQRLLNQQETDTEEALLKSGKLLLFNVDSEIDLNLLITLGIRGALFQWDGIETVPKAVKAVASGELWFPRRALSNYLLHANHGNENSAQKVNLTPREKEILAMVAKGMSNEQIAERLFISSHTVRTHLYNLFKKIGVPNRIQAALWVARHSLNGYLAN